MPVTVFTSSYQPTSCPHQHLVAIWISLFISLFLFVVIFIQTALLSRVFRGKSWVRSKCQVESHHRAASGLKLCFCGLRPLWHNNSNLEIKWKNGIITRKQKPLCEHLYRHLESKLLLMMDGPCSEPTEPRTTAGRGKVDAVFVTRTLGAYTNSKLMDGVSQMLNFWCEDGNHIIITILLLLFTFPLMQNEKVPCVFMFKNDRKWGAA